MLHPCVFPLLSPTQWDRIAHSHVYHISICSWVYFPLPSIFHQSSIRRDAEVVFNGSLLLCGAFSLIQMWFKASPGQGLGHALKASPAELQQAAAYTTY